VGLLFVIGEERGSDGAKAANAMAPGSKFLVDGEPTDNRLAIATRGIYRARLHARGRAAHSSQPELGETAGEKLIDAIVALRKVEWPIDPDLGETYYTVGLIQGGVAPNVVPADAHAELMFRTVGEHAPLAALIEAAVGNRVEVEHVLAVPPVRLSTLPDFETATFSFTTDIPFLDRWGTPLLIGPGSITLAHTEDESVEIAELHRAVDLYVSVIEQLLARAETP
jgi:acetylornithine deacetylase